MNNNLEDQTLSEKYFEGVFVTDISTLKQKLKHIKVFVFDWDGVFNDGRKNIDGHSSFSETDSMGINMMRFSYYLQHKKLPVSVIFTGENNKLAISFAQRENFHSVYYKTSNKKKALDHLCEVYKISSAEVLFVFDDVLDFSVAQLAGIRCMVTHSANNLLKKFAVEKRLVDYITKHNGNNNALREVSELIMMLAGNFDETIENRMHYSEVYNGYINLRKNIPTQSFITKEQQIIEDITA
jgi:3-deoxy-D-manno-octulosonate 8-phosphate phosphatase (KDO 8-P phosphatase)